MNLGMAHNNGRCHKNCMPEQITINSVAHQKNGNMSSKASKGRKYKGAPVSGSSFRKRDAINTSSQRRALGNVKRSLHGNMSEGNHGVDDSVDNYSSESSEEDDDVDYQTNRIAEGGGSGSRKSSKHSHIAGSSLSSRSSLGIGRGTKRDHGGRSVARVRDLLDEKQSECEDLIKKNDALEGRVRELQQVLGMGGLRGGSHGKNHTRKKGKLTGTDKMNAAQINNYLKTYMFPHVKFMPAKWYRWSEVAGSVCARVMGMVAVPPGSEGKEYWEDVACDLVNDKLCAMRATFKSDLRKQYMSKLLSCFDDWMLITITIRPHRVCVCFSVQQPTGDIVDGLDPKVSSDDGKLIGLTDVLGMADTEEGPDYDRVFPYLVFLDKYVSNVCGRRVITKFFKYNPEKTLLDKLTDSDIAYGALTYENSKPVWDEQIKVKGMSDAEKEVYTETAMQKYHKKSKKLQLYKDGWTNEGKEYYKELLKGLNDVRSNDVLFGALKNHWKSYARENNKYYYVRGFNMDTLEEDDEVEDGEEDNEEDFVVSLPSDVHNAGSGQNGEGGDENDGEETGEE